MGDSVVTWWSATGGNASNFGSGSRKTVCSSSKSRARWPKPWRYLQTGRKSWNHHLGLRPVFLILFFACFCLVEWQPWFYLCNPLFWFIKNTVNKSNLISLNPNKQNETLLHKPTLKSTLLNCMIFLWSLFFTCLAFQDLADLLRRSFHFAQYSGVAPEAVPGFNLGLPRPKAGARPKAKVQLEQILQETGGSKNLGWTWVKFVPIWFFRIAPKLCFLFLFFERNCEGILISTQSEDRQARNKVRDDWFWYSLVKKRNKSRFIWYGWTFGNRSEMVISLIFFLSQAFWPQLTSRLRGLRRLVSDDICFRNMLHVHDDMLKPTFFPAKVNLLQSMGFQLTGSSSSEKRVNHWASFWASPNCPCETCWSFQPKVSWWESGMWWLMVHGFRWAMFLWQWMVEPTPMKCWRNFPVQRNWTCFSRTRWPECSSVILTSPKTLEDSIWRLWILTEKVADLWDVTSRTQTVYCCTSCGPAQIDGFYRGPLNSTFRDCLGQRFCRASENNTPGFWDQKIKMNNLSHHCMAHQYAWTGAFCAEGPLYSPHRVYLVANSVVQHSEKSVWLGCTRLRSPRNTR